jgi:hypothetical protein
MAQLRKFLAHVGHAIQPEVHPPLLPGRVMIEEDRLARLPSSAAIEIGGDLAVVRQLSASGTSNTVKTRIVREGGIDILEILTYSESDEPQHGGTGSSEGSLVCVFRSSARSNPQCPQYRPRAVFAPPSV